MSVISLLIFLIILIILGWLLIVVLKKQISGLKIMLLGVSIIIFGSLFEVYPNSSLDLVKYSISFLGLIISILGFFKKD